MLMDIAKILNKDQNVVLICKKKSPEETLLDICASLKNRSKRICVVTVNKPVSFLIKKFEEKKINYSNVYFIDCISSSLMNQFPSSQCVYVSSPKALTELAIALNRLPKDIDLVILDSFSGLAFYNDIFLTYRFMNSIISKFRKKSLKSICLVVGETKQETISDLSLFSDKTIKY